MLSQLNWTWVPTLPWKVFHTLSNPWMKSLMLISVVYLSNMIWDSTYGVILHYADSVCDIPRVLWIFYNLDFFKRKKLCCTVTSQSCYILNMTKLCNKLTGYIQMHNTHFCLSFHHHHWMAMLVTAIPFKTSLP